MKRLVKMRSGSRVVLLGECLVKLDTHWVGKLLICSANGGEWPCEECRVRRPIGKWYVPVTDLEARDWRMIELSAVSFDRLQQTLRGVPWRGQMIRVERPNKRTAWEFQALGALESSVEIPRIYVDHLQEALSAIYDLPTPRYGERWSRSVAEIAAARMRAHHAVAPQLPFDQENWTISPWAED